MGTVISAVRTISCWTVGVLSLALQRQAFIKPKEMTQPVLALSLIHIYVNLTVDVVTWKEGRFMTII